VGRSSWSYSYLPGEISETSASSPVQNSSQGQSDLFRPQCYVSNQRSIALNSDKFQLN
jgi:hypothetical protein